MRGPLKLLARIDHLPGPGVKRILQAAQGQAVLHRTNGHAKVTADTFLLVDFVATLPVIAGIDGLMRSVLTDYMATAAFDAQILINLRLHGVIEIEVLPVRQGRNRASDRIG